MTRLTASASRSGVELVVGFVQVQTHPPGGVPDPLQEEGFRGRVVGGGVQRNAGLVREAARRGRRHGALAAAHGQVGGQPGQHGAHLIRWIVEREDRRHRERVRVGRPAQIGERRAGEHRVGGDQRSGAGLQMHCAPVDFDHPAAGGGGVQPIADLERLLEQHQQARDDLADRILQRQADDDRRDAQRGEQAADVRAPDVRKDDREPDRDEHEPRDVDEDRRNPLAPGPGRRALEQGGVHPGQQQDQHDEREKRCDGAYGGGSRGYLPGLGQQEQEGAQWQQVIAQYGHRPQQEALFTAERVLPFGERNQPDRQSDGDAHGPVEPGRGEHVGDHRGSTNRQIGSSCPSTDIVPTDVKVMVACSA